MGRLVHSYVWSKEGQGLYDGVPLITAIQVLTCVPLCVCLTGSSYLQIIHYSAKHIVTEIDLFHHRLHAQTHTHTHACRHFTARVHNQHALFLSLIRPVTALSSALICQDKPLVSWQEHQPCSKSGKLCAECFVKCVCLIC